MVESSGDDALCPGSFRLQLVHLLAGVQAVFTHVHPVIGGGRDHDTNPAKAADQEAPQLQTRVRHGASECVKTPLLLRNLVSKRWSRRNKVRPL